MKKLIKIIIILILSTNLSISVFAYQYNFSSGADTLNTFDKTTDINDFYDDTNVRRDKEAAYFPPEYGVFSGNIDTDRINPYYNAHNYTSSSSASVVTSNVTFSNSNSVDYDGFLPSTSIYNDTPAKTLPAYFSDGSIGTLSIPKLNINVQVYEGESLDNMRIEVGHFSGTSAWDNNVCIAGHNRGVPTSIGTIKNLKNGDEITYITPYGTRIYEVYSVEKIDATDTSVLGRSENNIITIITCAENQPQYRICVKASEKII
ncbi:MAG: class D sortase [Oscillospiraceae bacterium]|nr:class D sortase [Oscillospiraceae bacterium]